MPSRKENAAPATNTPRAAISAQKYASRPYPRGCRSSGPRVLRRWATRRRRSLAVSASECEASAAIAGEPVKTAAPALAARPLGPPPGLSIRSVCSRSAYGTSALPGRPPPTVLPVSAAASTPGHVEHQPRSRPGEGNQKREGASRPAYSAAGPAAGRGADTSTEVASISPASQAPGSVAGVGSKLPGKLLRPPAAAAPRQDLVQICAD